MSTDPAPAAGAAAAGAGAAGAAAAGAAAGAAGAGAAAAPPPVDPPARPGGGPPFLPEGDSALPVVALRLFAGAREAAGTGHDQVAGATVAEALAAARARYGGRFARVLASSRVWVNGLPAAGSDPLADGDELAVLPPVSGGAR